MRKAQIFMGLGVWIAVLPYLGFPHSWKTILYTATGLFLLYFGYMMYQGNKRAESKRYDNFKENSPVASKLEDDTA